MMDTQKIGRFLAELRKESRMTIGADDYIVVPARELEWVQKVKKLR